MASYIPVMLAFDTYEPVEGTDYTLSPVIFLHGMTCSRKYWEDLPQRVADGTRRKVYALDARNHGDSDWSEEFTFDIVAKDLDSFMERHGIRSAVLIGHSMGGIASIRLALTKPERVEKLVVEDMQVRKMPKEVFGIINTFITVSLKALEEIPEEATEEEAKKAIVDYMVSQMPPTVPPIMKQENNMGRFLALKKGQDDRFTYKANMAVLRKYILEYDEVEPQGTFEGPALFIYGKLSPNQVGKDEDNIKTHFPKAELVGVEGASHSVHNDYPDVFTEAIVKFISS